MLSQKTFGWVTSILFGVIAVGHVVRLLYGFDVTLAGWTVPMWASILGVVLAGFLSVEGCLLARKK